MRGYGEERAPDRAARPDDAVRPLRDRKWAWTAPDNPPSRCPYCGNRSLVNWDRGWGCWVCGDCGATARKG
jgi:ribosomal protein L37AE/L43A